jgi:hypothetical protein
MYYDEISEVSRCGEQLDVLKYRKSTSVTCGARSVVDIKRQKNKKKEKETINKLAI